MTGPVCWRRLRERPVSPKLHFIDKETEAHTLKGDGACRCLDSGSTAEDPGGLPSLGFAPDHKADQPWMLVTPSVLGCFLEQE